MAYQDPKGTTYDKKSDSAIVYYVFGAFLLFVISMAFGHYTQYGAAAKAAGIGWNLAGLIPTAAFVYFFYTAAKEQYANGLKIALLFVCLVVACFTFIGFTYPFNVLK